MSDASDPSQYNFEVFFIYNKMTYLDWKENYRLERIKRNEIWKDVPNYEGMYQVSNLGNVKSIERIIVKSNGFNHRVKPSTLNKEVNRNGYLRVTLSRNSSKKHFYIHLLVAYAFLGHKPSKHKIIVDHKDGNIKINNLNNLQLISQRENASKDRHKIAYTSKYVGVHWGKSNNKWRAEININRKIKCLGSFVNEYDAHLAYQKALSAHNNMIISK